MKTAQTFAAMLIAMIVVSVPTAVMAQLKLPFRSSKNVSEEARDLTRDDGPWLIMCASFVGDEGEQKARMLAYELRQHGFKSYLFRHNFDYSDPIQGIGWDDQPGENSLPKPKTMKVANNAKFKEVAVLVGDFPTVDDARAQKALAKIKSLEVESMKQIDPDTLDGRMRVYREIAKHINADEDDKLKGPMGSAFLLPNPMLPDEYFAREPVDKFVMDLNRDIEYSLLDCPGTYSVRVATFRGQTTFELDEISRQEAEQSWRLRFKKPVQDKESKLVIAAAKAHRLTIELRKMGIDAYEFHDRFESYVCVGSFDWIRQGNQLNPDVVKLINSFKATIEDLPGIPGAVRPKVLPSLKKYDIAFDPQPVPVLVPKANETQTSGRFKLFK